MSNSYNLLLQNMIIQKVVMPEDLLVVPIPEDWRGLQRRMQMGT